MTRLVESVPRSSVESAADPFFFHLCVQKYQPLDLRAKKTRAIRRALTKKQQNAKTTGQKKAAIAFPKRTYALKA